MYSILERHQLPHFTRGWLSTNATGTDGLLPRPRKASRSRRPPSCPTMKRQVPARERGAIAPDLPPQGLKTTPERRPWWRAWKDADNVTSMVRSAIRPKRRASVAGMSASARNRRLYSYSRSGSAREDRNPFGVNEPSEDMRCCVDPDHRQGPVDVDEVPFGRDPHLQWKVIDVAVLGSQPAGGDQGGPAESAEEKQTVGPDRMLRSRNRDPGSNAIEWSAGQAGSGDPEGVGSHVPVCAIPTVGRCLSASSVSDRWSGCNWSSSLSRTMNSVSASSIRRL